ncbi:MAG: ATP-binding protein, partial [Candidatus Tectomicrobia bacterium]|nr:ATP-binding protein [Candidatus Tectomicrobia bacterium]
MTEYRERALAATILAALEDMPVVAVTGMRQTGKSTFLQSQGGLKGRRYVTFDDFAQLAAAKETPERFIDTDGPLTIDEAQKCPEILDVIKKRVDKKRKQGQFLLSGSANFAVLKGISESLAGRAVYFTMHPFSRREVQGRIAGKPFVQLFMETGAPPRAETVPPIGEEEVLLGGMPTVCLGDVKDRKLWFKGYEQTYLERDIRQLSQISNIIQFKNLMELAALRTGQLLSPSELGRDAKLNAVTTARYLSLLEASFVVYRLPPYLKNRASRVIKSPKFYLADSDLACYLAGVQTLE